MSPQTIEKPGSPLAVSLPPIPQDRYTNEHIQTDLLSLWGLGECRAPMWSMPGTIKKECFVFDPAGGQKALIASITNRYRSDTHEAYHINWGYYPPIPEALQFGAAVGGVKADGPAEDMPCTTGTMQTDLCISSNKLDIHNAQASFKLSSSPHLAENMELVRKHLNWRDHIFDRLLLTAARHGVHTVRLETGHRIGSNDVDRRRETLENKFKAACSRNGFVVKERVHSYLIAERAEGEALLHVRNYLRGLRSPEIDVRLETMETLHEMGADAASAIPDLRAHLKAEEWRERRRAQMALEAMGYELKFEEASFVWRSIA